MHHSCVVIIDCLLYINHRVKDSRFEYQISEDVVNGCSIPAASIPAKISIQGRGGGSGRHWGATTIRPDLQRGKKK
jgi:hypothetical protein